MDERPELTARGAHMSQDDYIFGGQLVANALAAAAATVPHHFTCHVLHALFVASGDPAEPLEADVALVRDGRSLCNRLVTVSQRRRPVSADGGAAERRTILTLQASFQRASEWRDATGAALSHQQPLCPNVPPPEAVAPVPFIAQRQLIHEHRLVVPPDPTASRGRQAPREAEQMAWMRVSGRLREGSSGLGEECDGGEVAQLPPGEIHKVRQSHLRRQMRGVLGDSTLPFAYSRPVCSIAGCAGVHVRLGGDGHTTPTAWARHELA